MTPRSTILGLSVLAAMAASWPASARDWPATAGWEIVEGDGFCAMTTEYDGPGSTRLVGFLYTDGRAALAIDNFDWSARANEGYDLSFELDRKQFGGAKSTGVENDGRKGFVAKFGTDFFDAFMSAGSLDVRSDKSLVDSLSLRGSGAAGLVVKRCVSGLRAVAAAAERERAKFAHIPQDPFAILPVKPMPALPLRPMQYLIGPDDYPPAARKANAQGRVILSLQIGPDGRVTNCAVATSSGNTDLDTAACRLLSLRARFTPATDEHGAPIASTFAQAVTWALPD